MPTYTVPDLARRGSRYAFQLILQHLREGEEPFVTYGSIAKLLESKLAIPIVFPTHIGWVAGNLMDRIEQVDPAAPLINALITRPTGIPGKGFAGYYDRRLRKPGDRSWTKLGRGRKLAVIEEIRPEVRNYSHWDDVYRTIYGRLPPRFPRPKAFTERDGKPPETAGGRGRGESEEHRKLKDWAVNNPRALGLSAAMAGEPEADLLSGDRIDACFTDGTNFAVVEVKSIRSSFDDWQRGIYQCVKYRAVLEAQQRPVPVDIRAVLLTETELPPELKTRARELGVTLKVHRLNP